MKRLAALLSAAFVCCSLFAGCSGRISAPSETNAQSKTEEPTSASSHIDASSETVNPIDDKAIHAILAQRETALYDGPSWADAKPSGYNLYYGEEVVQAPLDLPSDRVPGGIAFYVAEDATAIVYCKQQKLNPLLVLVSGDMGDSWNTAELDIHDLEKYEHYDVSFSNRDHGYLLLSSGAGESLLFATQDAGGTWEQAASLTDIGEPFGLFAYEGAIFIAGQKDSYPMVLRSADGIQWNEEVLPVDRDAYTSGQCSEVFLDGQDALAVTSLYDETQNWKETYFASADAGGSWIQWIGEK